MEEAIENYKTCLQLQSDYYIEENIQMASTYLNIGAVYGNLGKLDDALENYNKCLNLQISKYGPNNPELASTYLNIGVVYH